MNNLRKSASAEKPSSYPVFIADGVIYSNFIWRLKLDELDGRLVFDLRRWILKVDDDPRPTLKGLCLSIEHLDEIVEALIKAIQVRDSICNE